MRHRDIEFFSAGDKLRGELFCPDGGTPAPGIVFCHGFGGVRQMFLNDFAKQFAEWGYTCLTFDYRGYGDSEGAKNRLFPLEQVHDISNAVTFLQAQEETDPNRVGLYGISFGAGNVVYAAGVDERIKATVSKVGFGDGRRWMREIRRYWEWQEFSKRLDEDRTRRVLTGESQMVDPNEILIRDPEAMANEEELRRQHPERAKWRLSLESAEAIVNFSPESVVHQISPRAVLFIGAGEDHLIPIDEVVSMYEKAGEPRRLLMMEGLAHHQIYEVDVLPGVLASVREWLDEHLAAAG